MEALRADPPCTHKLLINNITSKENVCFSLVLLKGSIKVCNINSPCYNNHCDNMELVNMTTGKTSTWPVANKKFKCLVDLTAGDNCVLLRYCRTDFKIHLHYLPRKTKFCVTPLYITCKDHDGRFQSPNSCDNSVEAACRKIGLGARLIQCLTAEKLYECGYQRRTFQLERDIGSSLEECVQFNSSLSVSEARSMAQEELWTYFGREIMSSSLSSSNRKFLAFLSCTEWDGTTRKVKAHAALGGGGLALFGTACLHTWPSTVENVIKCFLNPSVVDTQLLMDDSCYRGTYGACFSTTLGSVCHELGHTFDLGHPQHGIMGRGFDNVHLVFSTVSANMVRAAPLRKASPQCSVVTLLRNLNVECVIGKPEKMRRGRSRSEVSQRGHRETDNRGQTESVEDDLTHWSPGCAALLAYHRWFNTEPEITTKNDLRFDRLRLVVSSSAGLRVVEVRGAGGVVLSSWQYPGSRLRTQFLVPMPSLATGAQLLLAEDSNANIIKINL